MRKTPPSKKVPQLAPPENLANKIKISFTNNLTPSQRLDLLAKINYLIECETGATLLSVGEYMEYQSKSSLLNCSGSTLGRISG